MRGTLGLALVALLGRSHATSPAPAPGAASPHVPTAAGYFPLAVGNRWTYRTSGESQAVEQVEIRSVKDGQYSDNRGRVLWVSPDGLRDQSRVILRSPVEVGRAWTVMLGPESTERWRINSVGKSCSAPAGQFADCVEVQSSVTPADGVQLLNRITFAAGVGMVRIRTTLVRNGVETPQTELLLTAYTVAPLRPPPSG